MLENKAKIEEESEAATEATTANTPEANGEDKKRTGMSRRGFFGAMVAGGVAVSGLTSYVTNAALNAGKGASSEIAVTAAKASASRNSKKASYAVGQVILAKDDVVINDGRPVVTMSVTNSGDRPIQVCSHYHFFEANNALKFDREQAFGYHLDIPAGSAIRFEPGEKKNVQLTTYAGEKKLYGFQGWTQGCVDDPDVKAKAMVAMKAALGEG